MAAKACDEKAKDIKLIKLPFYKRMDIDCRRII